MMFDDHIHIHSNVSMLYLAHIPSMPAQLLSVSVGTLHIIVSSPLGASVCVCCQACSEYVWVCVVYVPVTMPCVFCADVV